MDDAQRKIEQDQQSVYVENGNVTVNYASGKKIPKHLGTLPIIPDVFLGRDADLTIVHDKLFAGDNLLLLVNGEGGIGKTTFASRYYHKYANEYTHVGWVFAEKSISDAMLTLANTLQLTFDERMKAEERLQELLLAMAELEKPCLLVIDNANTLDDLAAHYHALHSCSNFHLLLTTRITEFEHVEPYPINALDEENAIKLFTTHYTAHNPAENELLKEILTAVGYNTLVIELLAKNLRELNRHRQRYTLRSLLTDLQRKGLFALSQSTAVSTTYKNTKLQQAKPEEVLKVMYNLGELDEKEKALLSIFAVLPAEPIAFDVLDSLLPDMESFETALTTLATKGWIEHNGTSKTYKCSPVVQETTRQQNSERLFDDGKLLIDTLIDKLDYQTGTGHLEHVTYETGALYARYGESILQHIRKAENNLAILPDRIGNYHTTTGNLDKALAFYEQDAQLTKELYEAYPQNLSFKNGLAIAYCYIGNTHAALGNLDKALSDYENYSRLEQELYESSPENVEFKNNLAISYSKLGQTHAQLGNLDKALTFYEERSRLGKELYDAFPSNVSFKNGLAISYSKLGETHAKLGNLDKALTFYDDETHLFEELYDAFPSNVSFKNGLAISYSKLGQTHAKLGNLDKALTFYEERSRLGKELYDAFPSNVSFKNGLAISYAKLGVFYKAHRSDIVTAHNYFQQAEALWAELSESAPAYVEFQRYLIQVRKDLSELPQS